MYTWYSFDNAVSRSTKVAILEEHFQEGGEGGRLIHVQHYEAAIWSTLQAASTTGNTYASAVGLSTPGAEQLRKMIHLSFMTVAAFPCLWRYRLWLDWYHQGSSWSCLAAHIFASYISLCFLNIAHRIWYLLWLQKNFPLDPFEVSLSLSPSVPYLSTSVNNQHSSHS